MPAVISAGVEVLSKVKIPDCPGAKAVPVLFAHMMELPDTVLAQPSKFPGLVGTEGRSFRNCIQPYQKLLRLKAPVFCSVIV